MLKNFKFPISNFQFKIGLYLVSCILYLGNTSVYAASTSNCQNGEIDSGLGCVSTSSPGQFAGNLYTVGLGLVGGVAILTIIYGAFLVLSSRGDPVKLQNGKSYIVYSLVGLLLAVGGYAFYQIIGLDILHLPGFTR